MRRAAVRRRLFGRLARDECLEPRNPAIQVVRLNVRVAHRGGQVRVSKELLSNARIDACSEESRCEVVAQVMNEAREVREPSAVRDALEKLIEPALAPLLSLRREATQLAGHRITVYRKQPDGRWLLARDAHTLSPVGS